MLQSFFTRLNLPDQVKSSRPCLEGNACCRLPKRFQCRLLTTNSWYRPRRSTRRRSKQQRRSLSTPQVFEPASNAFGVTFANELSRLVDLSVDYYIHDLHHKFRHHELPCHHQPHSDRMAYLLHHNCTDPDIDGLLHQDRSDYSRDARADQGDHADKGCDERSYEGNLDSWS